MQINNVAALPDVVSLTMQTMSEGSIPLADSVAPPNQDSQLADELFATLLDS